MCFRNTGISDGLERESGTGHIKVFSFRGVGVGVFLFPGFDVKESCSCFDGVVRRAALIFMQQVGKGVEGRFLVKQKANLRLRQFRPRLFLLLEKWAGRLAVCIIYTHEHTHMQRYAPMVRAYRKMHICTQSICNSLWDVVSYSSYCWAFTAAPGPQAALL